MSPSVSTALANAEMDAAEMGSSVPATIEILRRLSVMNFSMHKKYKRPCRQLRRVSSGHHTVVNLRSDAVLRRVQGSGFCLDEGFAKARTGIQVLQSTGGKGAIFLGQVLLDLTIRRCSRIPEL